LIRLQALLQPVVASNPFLAGLRGNSSHRSLKLHPALKDYPAGEAGAEARSHPGPAGSDEVVWPLRTRHRDRTRSGLLRCIA
jgi:hypothetical protein